MNFVKRQHTVPQSYLRGFCIPNTDSLFAFDRKLRRAIPGPTSIEKLGVQKYYYDFDDETRTLLGLPPQTLENHFAQKIDTRTPQIISRIADQANARSDVDEDTQKKVLFAAMVMFIRSPFFLERLRTSFEPLLQEGVYDNGERADTLRLHPRMLELFRWRSLLPDHLSAHVASLDRRRVYWGVTSKAKLATSDNPVQFPHAYRDGRLESWDLNLPSGVEFVFPLTSQVVLLLVGQDSDTSSGWVELTSDDVRLLNAGQVISSYRQAFFPNRDALSVVDKISDEAFAIFEDVEFADEIATNDDILDFRVEGEDVIFTSGADERRMPIRLFRRMIAKSVYPDGPPQ